MKTRNKMLSLVVFLGLVFLLINLGIYDRGITGFTVEENSDILGNISGANDTVVTEKMALDFIEEAELIRDKMFENNFSVMFVDDSLADARREFEKAKYAEVLRNASSSISDVQKAREALSLVNWKKISYADVLIYVDNIKEREDMAFDIYDLLVVSEIKMESYEDRKMDVFGAQKILNQATNAFYEGRYEEAQILIEDARDVLEEELAQSTRVSVLTRGAKNFFQKNWFYIILLLFLSGVLGFFLYKKIRRNLLTEKVYKLKIELGVLFRLIKNTQNEWFKEKKISKMVYDIRVKKYREKINEIKEILPVLEKELSKKSQF